VAALEEQSSKNDNSGLIGGHHDSNSGNNNATTAASGGLSSSWGEHTAEARISELESELKEARTAGAQARAAAARATAKAREGSLVDILSAATNAVNRASAAEGEDEEVENSSSDSGGVCAALEKRIARALGELLTKPSAYDGAADDDDSSEDTADEGAGRGSSSVAAVDAAVAEKTYSSLARAVATCAAREAERHHILLAGALQEERIRAEAAAEAAGRDALALHAAKHRDQVQAAKAQREQLEQQLSEAREMAAYERRSGEAAAQASRDEVADLNGRISSLMAKVKDMCSVSSDGKAFGDSYEEVLAEEMAAMKTAFEAKLREKQRQIDELRRGRHRSS
jgi:predicted RNase H-like HicB family nuclease